MAYSSRKRSRVRFYSLSHLSFYLELLFNEFLDEVVILNGIFSSDSSGTQVIWHVLKDFVWR
jgi:hypothetical protein